MECADVPWLASRNSARWKTKSRDRTTFWPPKSCTASGPCVDYRFKDIFRGKSLWVIEWHNFSPVLWCQKEQRVILALSEPRWSFYGIHYDRLSSDNFLGAGFRIDHTFCVLARVVVAPSQWNVDLRRIVEIRVVVDLWIGCIKCSQFEKPHETRLDLRAGGRRWAFAATRCCYGSSSADSASEGYPTSSGVTGPACYLTSPGRRCRSSHRYSNNRCFAPPCKWFQQLNRVQPWFIRSATTMAIINKITFMLFRFIINCHYDNFDC